MQSLNKNLYALAICLSALAGCVDAIGFLQLGGYFISFMSGNSTRLAVNLVQGSMSQVLMVGGILLQFVIGAAIGIWIRHFSKGRSPAIWVLSAVTALLFMAAICNHYGLIFAAMVCMTMAMGAENAIFHRNGEVMVGLTYMTGTLVKIGQRLAYATLGEPKLGWIPYLSLWLGLMVGGALGVVLFGHYGLDSVWYVAFLSLALTFISGWLRHRFRELE